jgi:cytochrome c-type biogenesis protein CcmH
MTTADVDVKGFSSIIAGQRVIERCLHSSASAARLVPSRRAFMALLAALAGLLVFLASGPLRAADAPDLEDRTRALAAELRCVVCQNLSVADSPSEMAQQMRAIVREQLQAGKTPEEVRNFFVSKYGEWVLLKPRTTGISLLLWILPYLALAAGLMIAVWLIRRWANKKAAEATRQDTTNDLESWRGEILRQDVERPANEDSSVRAQLLRERVRLAGELRELEFDYQSGKHSQGDFMALRGELEAKALRVIEELAAMPTPARPARHEAPAQGSARTAQPSRRALRRWQLTAGGCFLLLFGLGLGFLLTHSLRPRASEQDTITGDFMTGTGGGATAALLQEGKQAFARQDFAKAIESFKQVLAQEPNQPEAHSYMGFILLQAGHGDGALMAFDKALTMAPNFPMALWGKGMVLYREKQDYAGAREIFGKLLEMIPPGAERNEVAKVLAEIPVAGGPAARAANSPATPSGDKISGRITLDPKLRAAIDPNGALFIIARQAGGAPGPPLAVKKVDKPTFPLSYSLGQENVMMQGAPFAGKIDVTARLDKDGNAMTREAGNLLGAYRKNPVAVGAQNVDITLDQIAQ